MTSRVAHVTELLGSEVCTGILPTGSFLTAEEVQARTSASRSAVREALGILGSLGLLRVRRRIGYEVCESTEWALLSPEVMRWRLAGPDSAQVLDELLELRLQLEPRSAALAAKRASPAARTEITHHAGNLWTAAVARDREAFVTADRLFHHAILRAAGNSLITELSTLLGESLPPRAPDGGSISLPEARMHLDLATVIMNGDAEESHRLATNILAGDPSS